MHRHQVAHRDIKPENVVMQSDELGSNAKLIDFGIARAYMRNTKILQGGNEILRSTREKKGKLFAAGGETSPVNWRFFRLLFGSKLKSSSHL